MRINPVVYGALVLVVFLGTIGLFQVTGIWSVSGKVTTDGQAAQPSASDANTIKGWMTLEQITATYNVPLTDLLLQFELPADTSAAAAIKDLESDAFSVTTLRIWLQSRISPTLEPTQSSPAAQSGPTTPAGAIFTPTPAPAVVVTPTLHPVEDKTITGKTTFQNLLDWGVGKESIQEVIGSDMPAPEMVIKDYITSKGLDFASLKTTLQAEVGKLK